MEDNRECYKLDSYLLKLLDSNERLAKESLAAYDENPEHLSPSPCLREIIEEFIPHERREYYWELATKWESEDTPKIWFKEHFYELDVLRVYYSMMSSAFQRGYCKGCVQVFIRIYDLLSKEGSSEELAKFLDSSIFSSKEIEYISEHRDVFLSVS